MDKASRVPFSERGGTLRGVLDLATGRYPSFLFGGSTDRLLPVFHLHEVTRAVLEPRLQFLAEHGYRTVTTDAIARLVRDGRHPGPFTVALCFDDARASLWTVAMPMLRKYNFCAITYAIPGRIVDANATRPTLDDGGPTAERADLSDRPSRRSSGTPTATRRRRSCAKACRRSTSSSRSRGRRSSTRHLLMATSSRLDQLFHGPPEVSSPHVAGH